MKLEELKLDGIRTIGMSICITLVVTSLFSMLIPNTKLEKVLKFAISLFFLTGLISPFFSSDLNFHIDMEDLAPQTNSQSQLKTSAESQFASLAAKNLESSIDRMLKTEGIKTEKIKVLINKNDDDNISINKLMVYIDNENINKATRIESIIKKEVGIVPSIININDNISE